MTDIKVIIDTGRGVDLRTLNRAERDVVFDQLRAENPDIPRVIIDSFAESQESTNVFERPTLKELLLRKIIQLSQNHSSIYNTVVIPIIPSLSSKNGLEKRPGKVPATPDSKKQGGAIPVMRPKPVKQSFPNEIRVRFDTPILASAQGMDYIAPIGEEVGIIGIIINPICSQASIGDEKLKPLTSIVQQQPRVGPLLTLGNYSYQDAAKSCDEYFTHPNYSINIVGETIDSPTVVMFADLDDEKIMRTLNAIFDYLESTDYYYHNSAASIHAQISGSISGNYKSPMVDLFNINQPEIPDVVDTPATTPILETLESIHHGKFFARGLPLLTDVYSRGFADIYTKSLLHGKDSKMVKDAISIYKDRQLRKEFLQSVRNKTLAESNKLGVYLLMIEKKLGANRREQIEAQLNLKPSLRTESKSVLELLKPAEKKIVELEYNRRQKYLEASINNKCPHVKLYKQFRHARDTDGMKKYFNELKKFFKNANTDTSMITCNNCGFDIICPHVRDFTTLDLAGEFHAKIKAKLTKYIDVAVVRGQYHCKICGEMISSLEAFGDIEPEHETPMNEELSQFMWGEIAILTKYLKFGSLINVPALITAARNACYPYIFEIEKQILKSKTNTADEIKAKKRLYVTIYAFAYFIHLILSNAKRVDISFKNLKTTPKTAIVDMIKHSIELIAMSRNVIIREIPGMSTDIIKNTLIEAYKSIQSTGAQVITQSGETEDILSTLLLDPVYHYIYTINNIDSIIGGKKTPHGEKGKYDMVERVDDYIGSVAKLEKSNDIFGNIKVPNFNKWKPHAFDNLAKFTHGFKTKYDDVYPGYLARSFELFNSKLKSRLYNELMHIDVATKSTDPSAVMDVKYRPVHEKYQQEYLKLANIEQELLKYRNIEYSQNYTFLEGEKSRRWEDQNVKLGRIYDEDGNPHTFDTLIVQGDEKPVEMKRGDISKGVESGKKFTDTVIDKKCSKCGVLWSEAQNLSEEKIRDSLHAIRVVSNFFRFYENRCPKGGLHDGNPCKKCKISMDYITKSTSKEALGYYREYRSVYEQEKAEFSVIEQATAKPKQQSKPSYPEYDNWTFNFNLVLDLANKLKINHRLIAALGAVEKQEYNDVQSGTYIPKEAEERNDTRIYVINSHIKNLLTEYNQIRFFHRLVKPPMDLSTIIDNSGINKHQISELSQKLPDIYNDYNSKFEYIRTHKKPREIVNFTIQSLCEMCLQLWNDADKNTARLRHDFVEYFVKKIIRAEELLSKPGHFNWSLLYGEKDKEKDTYDMNFNKDLESEKDTEYEETEKEDGMGDTNTPMVAEDFDVDRDPDADPMDDESNDQDWKVGENLGLD